MGMEAILNAGDLTPKQRRFPLAVLAVVLAGLVLLGVALAIKSAASNEVPLKPCATCTSCSCPTGLNGPRCGCPR